MYFKVFAKQCCLTSTTKIWFREDYTIEVGLHAWYFFFFFLMKFLKCVKIDAENTYRSFAKKKS